NGQSAVFYAASADNTAILKLFLRHGGDVTVKDYFGVTPLHEAAAFQPATVDILIEAGARVDERDDEGQTPLYWAVERGREDAVRMLIEKGGDINAMDACGMSPLSRACAQCCVHVNTRMVKLLIENGATVESKDTDWMTALHHASREGHTEIVALLLKRGARARDRDRS
ncbi:ankyrin, partial [Wilcoxina mikolae CBS 423.85]